TPRVALTIAEDLAFEHGRNVLVVMADMTSYAEALREVSAARGEIPGRRAYPGYLYSDLASLSRLMRKGAGPGRTRDDHLDLAAQLLASLSRSQQVRELAELVGVEALSDVDLAFVEFAAKFERTLLAQRPDEKRSLAQTLDLAWSVALALPDRELTMLPPAVLAAHRDSAMLTAAPNAPQ
ncbi:MAG TPA: hypothetical protein VII50_10695, partial [Acidothermaceae bacterium]